MTLDEIEQLFRAAWEKLTQSGMAAFAALQSDNAAAWVQAVGSILAIIAAFGIANRQSRDLLRIERRRDAQKAEDEAVRGSTFAAFLIPVIMAAKAQLRLILDAAQRMDEQQRYFPLERQTLMLPEPTATMNLIENASFLPIDLRMHVSALFAHISLNNELVRQAPPVKSDAPTSRMCSKISCVDWKEW